MSDHPNTNPALARAQAEDRCLLWCVHAGCTTGAAVRIHLGLCPIHESAIDGVLAGLVQRGLLALDGNTVALTDRGSECLFTGNEEWDHSP